MYKACTPAGGSKLPKSKSTNILVCRAIDQLPQKFSEALLSEEERKRPKFVSTRDDSPSGFFTSEDFTVPLASKDGQTKVRTIRSGNRHTFSNSVSVGSNKRLR